MAYALLLVYASLMPFDFSAGGAAVQRHITRAIGSWPFGRSVRTSLTDVLSNVALYVPLGALLATRWGLGRAAGRWAAAILAIVLASALSFLVEAGQLFSWWRIASAQDWLMNTAGAAAGGLAGAFFGPGAVLRLRRHVRVRLARRPLSLVAGALLLLLAADGLFPYLPTIDIDQLKEGLRASHIAIGPGFAEHPWHHWLLRRGVAYGALAAALGAASVSVGRRRWVQAALLATAFAALLEACKPFIVTRAANVANVAASAAGAVAGATGGWLLAGRLSLRGGALLAAGLLVTYLAYLECRPFHFGWDAKRARQKMPDGAAWLPMYHYAMGARWEDARLFARTLVLTGGLTVAVLLAWGRAARRKTVLLAGLATAALGLGFEALQFLLPGRMPTTTDVFTFALGGVVGTGVYCHLTSRFAPNAHPEMVYNDGHGA